MGTFYDNEFNNEPDTDWSLTANREWAEAMRDRWKKQPEDPPVEIPLVVAGEEISSDRETARMPGPLPGQRQRHRRPLPPGQRVGRGNGRGRGRQGPGRVAPAISACSATRSFRGWPWSCAGPGAISSGRPRPSTGKIFTEADVEVSEAIDFAEYYPFSARTFFDMENIEACGRGVGAVVSPWNFPIAIPCGGILAALAAGNTVIFKPASDAVLTAWLLCQCFWRAGVSRNVLQFLPCSGADHRRSAGHPPGGRLRHSHRGNGNRHAPC